MNPGWFLQLPDLRDWIEIEPFDYFLNQETGSIDICIYGTAPKSFVMGIGIHYRSRTNPKLELFEHRSVNGEKPFYMRWFVKGEIEYGAAKKDKNGHWRVKRFNEITNWDIAYDPEEKKISSFDVNFKIGTSRPDRN